jgi:hypothetical protein
MPISALADRYLRLTAYVVIIGIGIKAAAGVLNSLLLAAMLTIAVTPMYERLRRRGTATWVAITVTTLILLGVVLALIAFLGISTTRLVQTVLASMLRVRRWQAIGAQLTGIEQSQILRRMINLAGCSAPPFLSGAGRCWPVARPHRGVIASWRPGIWFGTMACWAGSPATSAPPDHQSLRLPFAASPRPLLIPE